MIDVINFFIDMDVINWHDMCWDFVIDEFWVVMRNVVDDEQLLISEFEPPWEWKYKILKLL